MKVLGHEIPDVKGEGRKVCHSTVCEALPDLVQHDGKLVRSVSVIFTACSTSTRGPARQGVTNKSVHKVSTTMSSEGTKPGLLLRNLN